MMSHCPGCSSRCCPRETLSKIRRPSEARSLNPRCRYPRDLRCTTSTGHLEGSEVFFLNWGDKTLGLQQSWQLGGWSCQRVNFTDGTFQKTSQCDPWADFQRGQRTGEKTLLPSCCCWINKRAQSLESSSLLFNSQKPRLLSSSSATPWPLNHTDRRLRRTRGHPVRSSFVWSCLSHDPPTYKAIKATSF